MANRVMVLVGLTLLIAASTTRVAQAGFVAGFSGNSQTEVDGGGDPHPASDGLINFAVWDTSTGTLGNWIADFAAMGITANSLETILGASGFESYVYLYQMVNTNPTAPDSNLKLLQIEGNAFLEGGYLSTVGGGVGFDELGVGVTGPVGNTALGTATTDSAPGDGAPGDDTGALDATPFGLLATAKIPQGLSFLSAENLWEFDFPNPTGPADFSLLTNEFSTIVFLVSNIAPSYLPGRVHDGDVTFGDVPSTTPEPGTFAMSAVALAIASAVAASRRKNVASA